MKTANGINLTMLCDYYELTMGNGYWKADMSDRITYFDVFFRSIPDSGGFAIAAGLEQIVDYVRNLHFSEEDLAYLRGRGMFDEGFLDYLKNFRFHGDIWAIPEGTPIFPGEPIITVRAPAIEAQLLETYMLLEFNHQSLIATKANRVCRAAEGRTVLEFGSRPVQELPLSAAVLAQPARFRIRSMGFRPRAPWPIPGYRCSTASMTPLSTIAGPTRTMPFCWWIPSIPCAPACRTPSALLTIF